MQNLARLKWANGGGGANTVAGLKQDSGRENVPLWGNTVRHTPPEFQFRNKVSFDFAYG